MFNVRQKMAHIDAYNRPISYLRISVTDRCNLRCVYCMPPAGVEWRPPADILSYEEITRLVSIAASLGIHRVRITGGEPLVRRGLVDLVARLAAVPGITDLSMTTNATRLAESAAPLAAAGLQRVNISLDSLRPDRFARITRGGNLADALAGIAAAREAGLHPIKINTVVIRDVNDDEVVDLARQTQDPGWNVRFIEYMPVGLRPIGEDNGRWEASLVPIAEIRRRIEAMLGPLHAQDGVEGAGPARYYRLSGASGTVGFISAVSEHFCPSCNRLRLSADGRLRPCLLGDTEIDLRGLLRGGAGDQQLRQAFLEAVAHKPERHRLDQDRFPRSKTMSQIGG
jgi:cyclic pyranopterin phosphate synthase